MFHPLGRRRKEYIHQRNGIPRRSTSLEQSRCSTSRGKYSSPSLQTTDIFLDRQFVYRHFSPERRSSRDFRLRRTHHAITQLIHEAKTGRKDLTVFWLDLANAYGSIPHQLIYKALQHYHIDGHIQKITTSYLEGIQLRFTVEDLLTRWQKLEKGIVTGCTVSVVLFIMGMNLLINAARREDQRRNQGSIPHLAEVSWMTSLCLWLNPPWFN